MKRCLLLAAALTALCALAGEEITFAANGVVNAGKLRPCVTFYLPNGGFSQNLSWAKKLFKTTEAAPDKYAAKLTMEGVPSGTLSSTLTKQADGSYDLAYEVVFDQAGRVNAGWSVPLDCAFYAGKTLTIDGAEFTIPEAAPENLKASTIFNAKNVSEIVLPTPDGKLTIKGSNLFVRMQDRRIWKNKDVSFRIFFVPAYGQMKECALKLNLDYQLNQ